MENETQIQSNAFGVPKYQNEGSFNEREEEVGQTIHLVVGGCILTVGTLGNVMTLVILSTKQLRKLSTCLYMSLMAVCDLGKFEFLLTHL